MSKVYLISEAYIKSHSNIDDSVDTNIVMPAIDAAQEIRLYELIGGKLLGDLKQVATGEVTSDLLKGLLDKYVLPFLCAQVLSDIQIPLHYKLKNNGILVNKPENTSSASMEEIQYLKEYYESQANLYANKMVGFISDQGIDKSYDVKKGFTNKTAIFFGPKTASNGLGGVGTQTTEVDTKIAAHNVATDAHQDIRNKIDNLRDTKVTKETGKGLSTNDFTDDDKAKIEDASVIFEVGVAVIELESDCTEEELYTAMGDGWNREALLDVVKTAREGNNIALTLIEKGDSGSCINSTSIAFSYVNDGTFELSFSVIEGSLGCKEFISFEDGVFGFRKESVLTPTEPIVVHQAYDSKGKAINGATYQGMASAASAEAAHAEGYRAWAEGYASHAEGYDTRASGDYSHAEGEDTTTWGMSSHAEGYGTVASGYHQHVQGRYNIADVHSIYADIIGAGDSIYKRVNISTTDWDGNMWVAGKYSQEGTPADDKDLTTKLYVDTNIQEVSTSLDGKIVVFPSYYEDGTVVPYAAKQGLSCSATGEGSHAEGSYAVSSGLFSHAEGWFCEAGGVSAHAEGYETVSNGYASHSEGNGTIANGNYQHAQGQFNIMDIEGKYAHIVGGGTDASNRANISTLDWSGNTWFAGKVSQEGVPENGTDLTTKLYVDDEIRGVRMYVGSEISNVEDYIDDGLATKVDTETGKGLSSNDYTTADKNKLAKVPTLFESNVAILALESGCSESDLYTAMGTGWDKDALLNVVNTAKSGDNVSLVLVDSGNEDVYIISTYISTTYTDDNTFGLKINVLEDLKVYSIDIKFVSGVLEFDKSEMMAKTEPIVVHQAYYEDGTAIEGATYQGVDTKASSTGAHAEGGLTHANGDHSHAEGYLTKADDLFSHAEGYETLAIGEAAHAEGYCTITRGQASHAEGWYTEAVDTYQHVQGKYNVASYGYADIIGGGEDEYNRANISTTDWDGNMWIAGKYSQEGTPVDDKDMTTKSYVDDGLQDVEDYVDDMAGDVESVLDSLNTGSEVDKIEVVVNKLNTGI